MRTTPVVVATRRLPPDVEARLARDYDFRANPEENSPITGQALLEKLDGADVLITSASDRIEAETIRSLPASVRLVAHFGIGYDGIPVATVREKGLAMSNTPATGTDDVADLTLGLIIATARRFAEGDALVRHGGWGGLTINFMLGRRVFGQTLGIVGFGAIGQALAKRARGFDMDIVYNARAPKPDAEAATGARFATLPELLQSADYVVLACPLTPETHHLIGRAAFLQMKPSAMLINVARGPVVDEAELVSALEEGRLAAAGLDVYEFEPKVTEALKGMKNTVLLPHLGTAAVEARNDMGFRVCDNIDAFFETGQVIDAVAE
jgi:glyoxylate reductase